MPIGIFKNTLVCIFSILSMPWESLKIYYDYIPNKYESK